MPGSALGSGFAPPSTLGRLCQGPLAAAQAYLLQFDIECRSLDQWTVGGTVLACQWRDKGFKEVLLSCLRGHLLTLRNARIANILEDSAIPTRSGLVQSPSQNHSTGKVPKTYQMASGAVAGCCTLSVHWGARVVPFVWHPCDLEACVA